MRGRFVSAEGIKGGPLIVSIYVEDVLKANKVPIPSHTELTLWAGHGCVCPHLTQNKTYLFLGFENIKNQRLLFDEISMAVTWRDVWYGRVKVSILDQVYGRGVVWLGQGQGIT